MLMKSHHKERHDIHDTQVITYSVDLSPLQYILSYRIYILPLFHSVILVEFLFRQRTNGILGYGFAAGE